MFVPDELVGKRADVVLAKIIPQYSRSQLSSWLKMGLITVNGQIVQPKNKIATGSFIDLPLDMSILNIDRPQCFAENIALNMTIINKSITFRDFR